MQPDYVTLRQGEGVAKFIKAIKATKPYPPLALIGWDIMEDITKLLSMTGRAGVINASGRIVDKFELYGVEVIVDSSLPEDGIQIINNYCYKNHHGKYLDKEGKIDHMKTCLNLDNFEVIKRLKEKVG